MHLTSLLLRLTASRPMRLISIKGEPYLERYHMLSLGKLQVWLHHFIRNDAEPHVHDHPWSALSVILTAGYAEEVAEPVPTPGGGRPTLRRHIRQFTAPALNLITGRHMHRITEVERDTWTLMIVSPRHGRGWFFYDDGPEGIRRRQPFASTPDDWWRTAGTRRQVYAELLNRCAACPKNKAAHAAIAREADACAHQPE